MTQDEAKKLVKQHGGIAAAARAAGMNRTTFRRRLEGVGPAPATTAVSPRVGKALDEFRAQHDKDFIIPQRIDAALKALGTGWEYELEFSRLAGVSLADLGNYRERYADYWLPVGRSGKRAWSGSKATAAKMREMVR